MKKCTICDHPYRGRGKLVFVAAKRGLRGVLACPGCVKLTVRILIQPPGVKLTVRILIQPPGIWREK